MTDGHLKMRFVPRGHFTTNRKNSVFRRPRARSQNWVSISNAWIFLFSGRGGATTDCANIIIINITSCSGSLSLQQITIIIIMIWIMNIFIILFAICVWFVVRSLMIASCASISPSPSFTQTLCRTLFQAKQRKVVFFHFLLLDDNILCYECVWRWWWPGSLTTKAFSLIHSPTLN